MISDLHRGHSQPVTNRQLLLDILNLPSVTVLLAVEWPNGVHNRAQSVRLYRQDLKQRIDVYGMPKGLAFFLHRRAGDGHLELHVHTD